MGLIVPGSLAPGFDAESFDGRRIRLESYVAHQHVVLVFLRGLR